MAFDTEQNRMSVILYGMPFRGVLVDAAESGITQGNRQAAIFLYSGVLIGVAEARRELHDRGNLRGIGSGMMSGNF